MTSNRKFKSNSETPPGSPPIRERRDIDRVRRLLGPKPRDLLLFDLACQTGVGLTRLLELKVKDLSGLAVGQPLPLEAGAGARPVMTEDIFLSLQSFLEQLRPKWSEYLFRSRKGARPLNLASASDLISRWFKEAGLQGLSGARTLRRTWELHFKETGGLSDPAAVQTTQGRFDRVEVATLQDTVHKRILTAVIAGRIKPGQRLLPTSIAQEMGVSTMTVREALLRLEGAGFFSRQGKTRFIVRELSLEDVEEIYDMRMVMETLAVERAVLRRSENTLDRLETRLKLMEQYAAEGYVDDFLEVHEEFHLALCRDAQMPNLQQVISRLLKRLRPYLRLPGGNQDRPADLPEVEHHRDMLAGLKRQDLDLIRSSLRNDLTGFRNRTAMKAPRRRGGHDTFRVGLCMSFSGPLRAVSIAVSNGCRLIANRFNARGGLKINGRPAMITFHEAEADFSAEEATAMARRLIEKDQVDFIVGALVTQTSFGVQSVTEPARLISLTTSMADEVIMKDKGVRYTFRSFIGVSETFPRLFRWLSEKHPEAKRLAMIDLDYASAWRGQEMVEAIAPRFDLQVVHRAFYPKGTKDFAPWLSEALGLKPDVILNVGSFPDEWALRMAEARRQGFKGLFLECLPPAPDIILPLAGSANVEGLVGIDYRTAGPGATQAIKQFRREYHDTYGRWNPFVNVVAPAFEAILTAFELAGSKDSDQVVKKLESGREFETSLGLSGRFGAAERYGQPHQWLSSMWLHQIRHGQSEALADGEVSMTDMIHGWD